MKLNRAIPIIGPLALELEDISMVNLMPWKKKNEIKLRNGNGALSRHSDLYPMARFREEFDQLWDRFWDDWGENESVDTQYLVAIGVSTWKTRSTNTSFMPNCRASIQTRSTSASVETP